MTAASAAWAARQGDAPVRYAGLLVSTHYEKWKEMGLRPGLHSPNFSFSGIKAWSDGSNQGLTGYQRAPYLNSTNRGTLNYSPEEIETLVRTLHNDGWPIGIHANGDAAWQCHLDDTCGSLEVGKAADLVVLERDPTTAPPDTLRSIRVHSTWLAGEARFQ